MFFDPNNYYKHFALLYVNGLRIQDQDLKNCILRTLEIISNQ